MWRWRMNKDDRRENRTKQTETQLGELSLSLRSYCVPRKEPLEEMQQADMAKSKKCGRTDMAKWEWQRKIAGARQSRRRAWDEECDVLIESVTGPSNVSSHVPSWWSETLLLCRLRVWKMTLELPSNDLEIRRPDVPRTPTEKLREMATGVMESGPGVVSVDKISLKTGPDSHFLRWDQNEISNCLYKGQESAETDEATGQTWPKTRPKASHSRSLQEG
ncbi:hypothetical protein B0H14DRAFT_3784623 [Mycena olivaceomarginata]|nr:hypothetical protein B0H14DRAFT_3784623 [Mycena olivaceomarginata]